MPTIDENRERWDNYDWDRRGEEWSRLWGSSEQLWAGVLLPRIGGFLPATTVLEIAPGQGRITRFLADHCRRLIGVDLAETCVEGCRRRFAGQPHLSFEVNDGRSLAMVADESIDLAFSFDSLVHVEWDCLSSYLDQLAAKLVPDGVAFLHHSDLADQMDPESGLPFANFHWRSTSVSATRVAEHCRQVSLSCTAQERVNWGGPWLTDCFSLVTRAGSRHDRPLVVRENPYFMAEAYALGAVAKLFRAGGEVRPNERALETT